MAMPPRTRIVLFYFVSIVLLTSLQVILPDDLGGIGGKPDLSLVLTILAGFLYGPFEGSLVGLSAGFLRDAFAGRTIGAGMLLCMYTGLLSAVLFRRTFRRNLFAGFLQVAIMTLLSSLSLEAVAELFTPGVAGPFPADWFAIYLSRRLVPSMVLNLAAALPILMLLHFVGPRPRSMPGAHEEGNFQEIWNPR